MADDDDHKPTDLTQIIAGMDVPITARMADKRSKAFTVPKYQTLSDGQWHRPQSERVDIIDDFTGEVIESVGADLGEATGPVPLVDDLREAAGNAKLASIITPMTEQMQRERAIHEYILAKHPERKLLRRTIDMTIIPAPKPKNDQDYRANQPKVPPRMRPKS